MSVFTPKPQPIISLLNVKIKDIECGIDHVLVLTEDKKLYTWGGNHQGQLGLSKKLSLKKINYYSGQKETNDELGTHNVSIAESSDKGNQTFKMQQSEEKQTLSGEIGFVASNKNSFRQEDDNTVIR